MIRTIFTEEDELLHKKCRKVEVFDEKLHTLLDDMAETMYDAEGVGLAAPQIGILRRLCVIDVTHDEEEPKLYEFINPEIIEREGEQHLEEGCLSMPGKWGITNRPAKVKVRYQDRFGKMHELEATELFAVCICHELDHLDGILFTERLNEELTEQKLQELREEDKKKCSKNKRKIK